MKFALVFEAIDNASKAFANIAKAHKGMSEASAKGASKVASAFEKSTRATGKQAQATEKAARGWRGEANSVERLNKVLERHIRIRKAAARAQLQAGLGNLGRGARGAAKYGMWLGGAAMAADSAAFGAAMLGAKGTRE